MNISSESAFGQGGSSASSAIDGEDSIFDRGLTDFMDGSPAGRQMQTYRTFDRSSTFTHNVHFALRKTHHIHFVRQGLPTVNGNHNGKTETGSSSHNSGHGTPTVPLSFSAVDLSEFKVTLGRNLRIIEIVFAHSWR